MLVSPIDLEESASHPLYQRECTKCDKMKNFSIWRRFRDPKDLSGAQDRALTRNELYTWLEELASESNTIQAQGIISAPGRL